MYDVIYEKAMETLKPILNKTVVIKTLAPKEAIGNVDREDYPIIKGKEIMIEADIEGKRGQAFTSYPINTKGTLKEFIEKIKGDERDRAIAIASINAGMNYLGLLDRCVHCKDDKPKECGKRLALKILREFGGDAIVAHIGFQPGHIEATSKLFKVYITDLNPENIGKEKFGTVVLDGKECNDKIIKKSDIALITGSTIVNGTFWELLKTCEKYDTIPIIYGVTVQGVAKLLGMDVYCPFAGR
ncbi:Rossmann-like domain-containing protein [Methanotorris igneus]|uniref:Putative heavy-metal chelation domain-containing protein n=1 Tax=Methanotorris igneus (strain DSM 5666 / JCM 11834 / Kol 5) TaxID=880724 RepID=F6BAS1_METIK|nr:DUF364 domain-containing protein [Methanotorris igneus]AEF95885.1 protein of unknown function DUF364 [Methanotorris igneus Kol 5]